MEGFECLFPEEPNIHREESSKLGQVARGRQVLFGMETDHLDGNIH